MEKVRVDLLPRSADGKERRDREKEGRGSRWQGTRDARQVRVGRPAMLVQMELSSERGLPAASRGDG